MDKIVYHSEADKSNIQAIYYCKTHESSHRYLAYRDIPSIALKHLQKGKALDYGTGTGYSAQFLQDIGFDVTGVDVSNEMLHQAALKYPSLSLHLIENGRIPFADSTFDLVFSSFVLFEIGTHDGIVNYLAEATRVMQVDGLFIAVTGSHHLHSTTKKWLNFNTAFPQNVNLESGNLVKLHLYDSDLEFSDYYWTESDYRYCFDKAGFELIEILYPLGEKNDVYLWRDEIFVSPFVILVSKIK